MAPDNYADSQTEGLGVGVNECVHRGGGAGWSSYGPFDNRSCRRGDENGDKQFAFDTLPHLPPDNGHNHLAFDHLPQGNIQDP